MCQNIKCAHAEVKPETIQQHFDNLEKSLKDVPAENILNYDETNLSDDPGVKKCVFRRRVKYPERAINYSRGNISLMFAGTAAGELLPPYVIYKGECLWSTWCEAGPEGAQYGRSKNGWMDSSNLDFIAHSCLINFIIFVLGYLCFGLKEINKILHHMVP
ncbi:Pogo transposable element with KRAB domain [Elysia marginata]|uniref:Pogo transposable element with KRAB domain n=1 Tax=Elysia marginata TaxID=1093978 RepID=A0AAV4HLL0_9GAST|nr:Pogo transposable element with KRAB domain [Elysia marginata]